MIRSRKFNFTSFKSRSRSSNRLPALVDCGDTGTTRHENAIHRNRKRLQRKRGHEESIVLQTDVTELGYFEINPTGFASMLGLFVYAGFLCILIGKAAEVLVSISLKGGVIMKKVRCKNHFIICGWNYQGSKIIESLLSESKHHEKPIVILADLDKPPFDSDKVDFISGKPWRKEDLIKAGILDADSAIILTDIRSEKSQNPDADALMITLAIESLNKDVHTSVQQSA